MVFDVLYAVALTTVVQTRKLESSAFLVGPIRAIEDTCFLFVCLGQIFKLLKCGCHDPFWFVMGLFFLG